MQFIKKNYEKILLGLVLVGLVAVAVFLLFLVANEQQAQEDRRNKIINRPVKPLPPPDMTPTEALLKRLDSPVVFNFADTTHKLFNPVRWQKAADGHLLKNPVGTDLLKLEVVKITPLYFNLTLDSVTPSEAGVRYGIAVEDQGAAKPGLRGHRPFYVSKGDKVVYGEKKETFTLRDITGPPESPTDMILDMSDSDAPVSIAKDKPFKRVDGYMTDLKYTPENRTFLARRVGDKIVVAGEDYNIVAINESEVVLSAKSNQKKWTIKYNPGP